MGETLAQFYQYNDKICEVINEYRSVWFPISYLWFYWSIQIGMNNLQRRSWRTCIIYEQNSMRNNHVLKTVNHILLFSWRRRVVFKWPKLRNCNRIVVLWTSTVSFLALTTTRLALSLFINQLKSQHLNLNFDIVLVLKTEPICVRFFIVLSFGTFISHLSQIWVSNLTSSLSYILFLMYCRTGTKLTVNNKLCILPTVCFPLTLVLL